MAFGGAIFPPSAAGGTFVPCVDVTATGTKAQSNAYAGFTGLTKFLPAALAAGGSTCRVTVQGPLASGSPFAWGQMWIGQGATSGNAYNFDGGQVQLLFSGSASGSLGTGASLVSDTATFAVTQSRAIIVAWQVPVGTPSNLVLCNGLSSNFVTYLSLVQEAGTTLKSAGYSPTNGQAFPPFLIEVA